MPAVSVIIVNYNGGNYPAQALETLARQTFRDFEVIFLDNASTDGSAGDLPIAGLPAFRLINQEDNLGFARGNNVAAAEASGRWLALLNPDAFAEPDWLEQFIAATRRHADVIMFASAQYEALRPDRMDGAGDAYMVFGVPWRGGYGRPASEMPKEGYCFSPCGAGAFFRRDIFLQHGGFDERFFCYCEDVDLGYRLQLAGHDCVFLPDAVIRHVGGGSSNKVSGFALFHGSRNRLWTYLKNTPLLLLILTLPGHLAMSLLILARGLMTGRAGGAARGMWAGLKGARAIMGPGVWAPPRRQISLWRLARRMSWNPFRMLGRRVHVRTMGRADATNAQSLVLSDADNKSQL